MVDTPDDGSNEGSLTDQVQKKAARAAVNATLEATADAAVATAGKVATGVLDTIEALLFGRVGGAEEAAKADEGDPITRMRTRYNADVAAVKDVVAATDDPVARAHAELEALKAARDKRVPAPDAPAKKTL